MDILKAIVHSPAGYLDEGVLKLLATELKRSAGGSGSSGKTKPKAGRSLTPRFGKHAARNRA